MFLVTSAWGRSPVPVVASRCPVCGTCGLDDPVSVRAHHFLPLGPESYPFHHLRDETRKIRPPGPNPRYVPGWKAHCGGVGSRTGVDEDLYGQGPSRGVP